jgi:hypothetical protein
MIDWYLPALTNAQLRVDLLPMNLPDHPSAPAPSGPYVAHGSWLWSGGARRRDPHAGTSCCGTVAPARSVKCRLRSVRFTGGYFLGRSPLGSK